ncbi:hypothetical protein [uncultured Eubacterium sp.]|uniref:hypothetical protein n=1 Tax=uncultured Eubacterium sp. TaxID=165185 RepID=UPI002593A04E|nr:hypothetical protein [uncultured Eubacterium sp.]
MSKRRIYSLEDLYNLISKDKANYSFNSERTGYQLAVQIPAQFEIMKENNDDSLLFCKVKLMHSGENRNHSSVADNALIKASKTLAYKPVLANFMEYTDEQSGETLKDFTSHDIELDDDNNIVYIEKQVGCFTSDDAFFEVEEESGHNFLYGYCAIPRDYTAAASIIERKGGTKISVELGINEMQYNTSSNVLELTDVTITGATLLGKNATTLNNVEEGMKNARVDLLDFSEENNSLFSSISEDEHSKLIETLDKLNKTLSGFNINQNPINNFEKGGFEETNMTKFEELLKKYNKTAEDVTFEYEGLSDEELEAVFEATFDEVEPEPVSEPVVEAEKKTGDSEPNPEDEPDDENDPEPESGDEPVEDPKENSEVKEKFTKTFELSHEDVRAALYQLLAPIEETLNEYYYIVTVYDNSFIYESCCGNFYKQSYTKENDSIAFEGERQEVFTEFVTADEKAELESMRANYSSISEKLAEYEEAEEIADKMTVFEDEAYSSYLDTVEFKALMEKENVKKFTKEELAEKADAALGKVVKTTKTFAMNSKEQKVEKPSFLAFGRVESNTSFLDGLLNK